MSANSYHFVTHWRVEGTCGEVADILGDPLALARWWPSVYLQVEQLAPGGPGGVGTRAALLTKGWLPYSLAWEFEVTESRYPHGFTLKAAGDFVGRGEWTFTQNGSFVDVTYDWRLDAEKPLLRKLSFLIRPLFEANHRWAMARGEESLKLELLRRRAASAPALSTIPAPPGPVTFAGVGLLAGIAVVGGALTYLIVRAARRRGSARSAS